MSRNYLLVTFKYLHVHAGFSSGVQPGEGGVCFIPSCILEIENGINTLMINISFMSVHIVQQAHFDMQANIKEHLDLAPFCGSKRGVVKLFLDGRAVKLFLDGVMSQKMQAVFGRQKGGHGPRRSMSRKLGTRARSLWVQCFAKIFLARNSPYTLMSHTKMSIVFGKVRSKNYSPWKPAR